MNSIRAVAVLETMWDWRSMTSGAGYSEAPRYFRINPENVSGRRLYRLVGPDTKLLVTNACRELVTGPKQHGTPSPTWLRENLEILDGVGKLPDGVVPARIDLLLVCGRVAQGTYKACGYVPRQAKVIEIPHPAARFVWTHQKVTDTAALIQSAIKVTA